jgi:hypothetical protein
VKSQLTDDFRECYARLPDAVKELARKAYRQWVDNPSHPGLRFKKVHGQESVYAVRIGRGWRDLGLVRERHDYVVLDWISLRIRSTHQLNIDCARGGGDFGPLRHGAA